jgi:hypothetical protein
VGHRSARVIFALLVGLLVAYLSYQWISNPAGRQQRVLQLTAVESSRALLIAVVDAGSLEIVDPLSPNRIVGKVYVYPEDSGWAVSGFYRRSEADHWHPYLMYLQADYSLISVKLRDDDTQLMQRAESDNRIEISR